MGIACGLVELEMTADALLARTVKEWVAAAIAKYARSARSSSRKRRSASDIGTMK